MAVTDALRPARGYRWPSFETTHGAHTPSIIEPLARDLVAWLLAQAAKPGSPIAFVAEEHFSPTLDKWARAEARRMRYEGDIDAHGEFDERGNQRPVALALVTWEKRATFHASALGLDPPSLARIRKDMAVDVASEVARTQAELIEKYGRPRRPAAQDGAAASDVGVAPRRRRPGRAPQRLVLTIDTKKGRATATQPLRRR